MVFICSSKRMAPSHGVLIIIALVSHLKKRALLSFGLYPDVSLATAREKRDEARTLVASGIDPQHKIKQQREHAQYQSDSIFFCCCFSVV